MNDQDPIESIEPGQLPPDPYNPLTKLREDQSNAWEPRCIAAAWECRTNDRAQYEELVNVLREKKFKRLTEWEQAVKQFGAQQKRQAKEVVDRLRVISSQAPANEHRELTDLEQRHTREAQEYRMSPGSIWWQGGPQGQWLRIANFSAVITHEFVDNDGLKTTRSCEIEAIVGPHRRVFTVTVPASEYSRMDWVNAELGTEAVIAAGGKARDILRAGIQLLSIPVERKTRYGFTGWHHHSSYGWIYLHAKGAIGSNGPVEGVTVAPPPDVSRYELVTQSANNSIAECLELINIKPSVTVALFGSVWRAAVGAVPVTVYLSSKTAVGKSMFAGLAVQHFAPWHHGKRSPATWKDSTKSLLKKLSSAGDSVILIDDFVLKGTLADHLLIQKADDVIRAQYSDVGRSYLTKDNKMVIERPSRCVLLVTGETLPPGQSLRNRSIVVHLDQRVEQDMTKYKTNATAGHYAGVVKDFVQWIAPNLETIRKQSEELVSALVRQWNGVGIEDRTGGMAAELAAGLHTFLTYCVDCDAITEETAKTKFDEYVKTLCQVCLAQSDHSEDPAVWFSDLLREAIASGNAHVCNEKGLPPDHAKAWGWDLSGERPRGKGEMVGWTDGESVWILPTPSLKVTRSLANAAGKPLVISHEDLGTALHDAGLLAQMDQDRRTFYVRKTINRIVHSTLRLRLPAPVVSEENEEDNVN